MEVKIGEVYIYIYHSIICILRSLCANLHRSLDLYMIIYYNIYIYVHHYFC